LSGCIVVHRLFGCCLPFPEPMRRWRFT
jgi:hypothetical protein